MCKPASFIVTKDKVFWSKKTDSHEDIIAEFKLHADGAKGPNIVRVEITPPNDDFSQPLDKWNFTVDQENTPKWWDAEADEKRCRLAFKEWAVFHIHRDCEFKAEFGMHWAFNCRAVLWANSSAVLWENSRAELWANSSAVLRDNSSAVLWENSRAVLWENSRAELWDNSRAVLWENSSAVLRDNSSAELWENSSAELRDNSRAVLRANSRAVLRANSRAELRDNSRAVLWANSSAELWDNSSAVLWENSSAELWDNSSASIFGGIARLFSKVKIKIKGCFAVAIDLTGDKAVCHVGNDKERQIKIGN